MKLCVRVLLLVGIAAGSLFAQAVPAAVVPAPKYELYGGFSRMRGDIGTDAHVNGWAGAFAVRLNRFIGLGADGSGAYAASENFGGRTSLHTITAGPRIAFPIWRVAPFIHAGIGWARWGNSGSVATQSGFAKQAGLGFDVNLTRSLSYRLIQADYLKTPFRDGENAVFSTGLIWGIGRR